MVRKALMKDGAGFWVLGLGVGAEQDAVALGEAAEIVRDLLVVIFNTPVAAEATARGANGDCGRRKLRLDAGYLARIGLLPGLRAGLAAVDGTCSVLAHLFAEPYFSYSPVFLFGRLRGREASVGRLRGRATHVGRLRGRAAAPDEPQR